MNDIIVAYVPVIHRGYLNYFASTGANVIYVIQASDVPQFEHLVREMRALSVEELAKALQPLGYDVRSFATLRTKELPEAARIFVPDDDVTRSLQFDREVVWGSWFLRWDWSKSSVGTMQPSADRVIRKGDQEYGAASERMKMLLREAQKSSDWWRQVAACAVFPDGRVIVAYNHHQPHEHIAYIYGDPRDSFKPGEFIEISVSFHAEAAVIAEAARLGISTEGAEMSVTVFPCQLCAQPIAHAGFQRLFFTGGYSNLHGQEVLRSKGVELVFVEM